MTTKFTDVRTSLVSDLGDVTVNVFDPWPAKVEPPALVIVPNAPYVTVGSCFGAWVVHLNVVCLVSGQQVDPLTELDDLIDGVLTNTTDWGFQGLDGPAIPADRPDLIAVTIQLAKEV